MKNNLLIRADGNSEIGLGHLVRCNSLAQMLTDDFNIRFFCLELPEKLRKEITDNFSVELIESESEFIDQYVQKNSVTVLDGYQFDAVYQKKIKEKGGKLVCIDDIFNREFFADLIINHAPGIRKEDYIAQGYTKFALGPEYALLRPNFLEHAKKDQKKDSKDTLLICFGGSDNLNKTIVAAETALGFDQFKKIIIITGSAYNFQDELKQFIDRFKKIEYYHSVNEATMLQLMSRSGTAIVPSSGILFEALATDNIAISGTYTDNQKRVYRGFKNLGAIIDAGNFNKNEIAEAIQNIDSYQKNKLIDGKSPERIRKLFKNL